ncbi:MAG TPA: arylsulfatase [Gemmataceae bacterium]
MLARPLVLLSLAGLPALAGPPGLRAADRPNIVFVLADDLGQGDLGCYNRESKIPTPNLDRLAAQGMRFTDAHSPSSVCTPTRYGVLTGRYCWRSRLKSGVLQGYDPLLIEPGRVTVASLLKRHGYATAGVGKWHLGLGDRNPTDYARPLRPGPLTVGFDSYFGIPASLDMPPYLYVENDRPAEAATETIEAGRMRRKGGGGFWRAGAIAPGFRHIDVLPRITERAVRFIEKHAAESPRKPFFLYVALSAPHTPWMPTEEFRGMSGAGPYGDFVAQVDDCVGRVAAALEKTNLAGSTLFLFTSDNGAHWTPQDIERYGHLANGQRRGQKADIWEGGHRVPFIARWPGKVQPGAVSDRLVCLTDFLATAAAVAGAELPEGAGEDSYDMLPALLGTAGGPVREAVVHHSADGMFAIRQGYWKLIEGLGSGGFSAPRREKPTPGGPEGQLYNLADDPREQKNLYLEKPEIVSRLSKLLTKYREQGHSRPAR